ncbi:hypothetical protein [uncultured Tateyamaria sp.]|uniref:hypothetical protein n=1 Tax=uncultured Tateyamaria sp. TaxID=455651 RepID=UPI002616CD73|nr:hypothetical protein [uncultured Tateyamaria sp.]
MQINRSTLSTDTTPTRAFCPLECEECRGMCLPLYMMLTRDEQDEMCRRYGLGAQPVTRH